MKIPNKATISVLGTLIIAFILVFPASEALTDEYTATDIDILKKIASRSIISTLQSTRDLDEAASVMGIDREELKRICYALDISSYLPEEKPGPAPLDLAGDFSRDGACSDLVIEYGGSSPYLLVVEKSTHRLFVLKIEGGTRTLVETFGCKTGKNHGDKEVTGDKKTPEGIYFLTGKLSRIAIEKLVGKKNAYQYGEMAFVTDFPNSFDKHRGKNGSGIWLHGTDEEFDDTDANDTRGCVVTTNETIRKLSDYITLNRTALVIVDTLNFIPENEFEERRRAAMDIIDGWRSSWEAKNVENYIGYYSPSFSSQGMSRTAWKNDKNIKFRRNREFEIKVEDLVLLEHESGMIAYFHQDYSVGDSFRSVGMKTLYMVRENDSLKIIAEQFQTQ